MSLVRMKSHKFISPSALSFGGDHQMLRNNNKIELYLQSALVLPLVNCCNMCGIFLLLQIPRLTILQTACLSDLLKQVGQYCTTKFMARLQAIKRCIQKSEYSKLESSLFICWQIQIDAQKRYSKCRCDFMRSSVNKLVMKYSYVLGLPLFII